MIYSEEEVKEYKGFKYVERHGMRFFILEGMSRADWLRLRNLDGALGGSDVGTIMGWNDRFSRIELFYQKIGLNFSATDSQTQYTYWGSKNEAAIMHTAQFYDFNDPEAYLYNEAAGIYLRTIDQIKFSIRNPKVPYINANVDGLIDYDPVAVKARRIAESKTISRQSAEKWESIPPYHLGQVIMYTYTLDPMLTERAAEIYYLKDGNNFYGWEIPQNDILLEMINEQCVIFHDKVQKGIEIVTTTKSLKKREQFLQEIEPEPDSTPAYEQFMREAYKNKKKLVKIVGDQSVSEVANKYTEIDAQIKALDKELQKEKNKIWSVLNKNSASIIELENGGKISFNRRLYVNSGKQHQ